MIYIYDKEYYFVADIAYEYVIILNLISQIITINRNNIIVLKVVSAFSLGDHGFLVEKPFGTCLICAHPPLPPPPTWGGWGALRPLGDVTSWHMCLKL